MKLLAIETSTATCSVALFDSTRALGEQFLLREQHSLKQQASLLLPIIESSLEDFALHLTELNAIAYGCGPGSYTGIRLAASAAQALAYGLDLPVIPVSSTAAMAQTTLTQEGWKTIAVCIDARMGQIYWANYIANDAGELKANTREIICCPDDLAQSEDAQLISPYCGVGDGWNKYEQVLLNALKHRPTKTMPNICPRATAVITLAKAKFEQSLFVEPKNALPVYLQ